MADLTFANSVSVYLPAASDSGNSFVQSATTFLTAPATWVGDLNIVNSTSTTPSKVYVGSNLLSSYPWTQYNEPGHPITFYVTNPLSG